MRSHAKASSAGSTLRRAVGRKKLGVLALSVALLGALVLVSASAFASKGVVNWIGSSPQGPEGQGGQFSYPRGVAVNSTGAGGVPAGTIYVGDQFDSRIQQFGPDGAFVRTWGFDVIRSGKPGDLGDAVFEVCEVATDCKQGTYISPGLGGVVFGSRGIAVDQSTGAIYVSEPNLHRVQKFSASGSFQAVFGKDVVSGGATTTEVCTVSSECKEGEAGEAGGELGTAFGSSSNYLAVAPAGSPNAGDLYVADSSNRRIQQFDSSGAFVAAFGGDVESPAGGSAFEACTVAADCKAGSEGSGDGEFAFESPNHVAVDDAGRIYAVDDSNNRVQRFTSAPAFDTIYGATQLSGSPGPIDIAIDPGATSAGDASDDHVFVVKPNDSPSEHRIKELGTAADPSLIDTHMSDMGIDSVYGLAVDTSSDRLFVSSETGGKRVYFLDDAPTTPTATINPVTVTTDTTATFSGTVDPNGARVACKFEYSTDQSTWVEVPVSDCEQLDIDDDAQAIDVEATGLVPNTNYHVRLQVDRSFPPLQSATTAVESFASDSVPPVVFDVGSVQVEDTSARLVGTIDPRNADTSYVFEYGATPAFGSSTGPLAIGGGIEPVVVSQVLTGLGNDTTYYFRLVATNEFGSTPSAQLTLHTRAEPFAPPDDRAYEQVSPVDKNFGNAVPGTPSLFPTTEYVAQDGQAVVFGSQNAFGSPPAQILKNMASYISNRDANGWHTQRVFPNTCAADPKETEFFWFGLWVERAAAISANADHAVIPQREYAGCETPALDPAAPLPATNLYRANFIDDPVSYDLLVPGFDEPPTGKQSMLSLTGEYIGASDDFSRIYYGTGKDTSGGKNETLNQCGCQFTKIWEWDNGTLRLASVEPDGDPFSVDLSMVSVLEGDVRQRKSDAVNSVSSDGSRFFFEAPFRFNEEGPVDIYMRESGIGTYNISESECTDSCGGEPSHLNKPRFQFASADGSLATFTTPAKLVNADTNNALDTERILREDLYAYVHSQNPTSESNLSLITKDEEPAPDAKTSYHTRTVREVLGVADDGSVVYFTGDRQLVAGAPTEAGLKVFRWSWNDGSPTLQYLALASNDRQLSVEQETSHWERRVTRSGDTLMMESKARIDPVVDSDQDIDVYLWRAESGWTCVSCQTPGVVSNGDSTTGRVGPRQGFISATERPVARDLVSAMSEDASRIYFQTQEALVSTDTNGPCSFDASVGYFPCTDIYEWHDGRLSLITTGTGSRDLGLIGVSESGEDVFFFSAEKLVGWDKDNLIDVYDARVGGGLPEPPPQPAACEGEACRGASSSTPDASGAGTAVFQGPGNPPDKTRKTCPKGKRKVRRAGKARCVKRRPARKANRVTNNNRRTAR